MAGSFMIATSSAFSRATIATGVPEGTRMPKKLYVS
jgi:hypothetical protein